ncbi:MAG: hypothetical protein SGBAC_004929 [Bacillariaceae sp.]
MDTPDEISVLQHDDITYNTEETDDLSVITHHVKTENLKKDEAETKKKGSPQKKSRSQVAAGSSNKDKDKDKDKNKDKKKLWGAIAALAIVVGILAAMLISKNVDDNTASSDSSAAVNGGSAPTSVSNDGEQPTSSPTVRTFATLRDRVEFILRDYEPLDQPTMTWLLDTPSTYWQPPPDDPQHADYLWMERYAMGLLFSTTNGPNWARNDFWMSHRPVCRWFSLEPNACPGPMVNLTLYLNKMEGTLPSVLFGLSGLQKIHLARNELTGSTIPLSVSKMKNLTFLDLGMSL